MSDAGSCAVCGYDLAGIPAEPGRRVRCPECGHMHPRDGYRLTIPGEQLAALTVRGALPPGAAFLLAILTGLCTDVWLWWLAAAGLWVAAIPAGIAWMWRHSTQRPFPTDPRLHTMTLLLIAAVINIGAPMLLGALFIAIHMWR